MELGLGSGLVVALAAVACGGDGTSDGAAVDAAVDSAPPPVCSGAVYEPCANDAACTSGMCRQFNMLSGKFLCTQACTGGCPAINGAPTVCNSMGTYCKATQVAVCTPP